MACIALGTAGAQAQGLKTPPKSTLEIDAPVRNDSLVLDLPAALEIALNESPLIQIADKEITRKQYYKRETQGGLLPSLDLGASYSRTIQKQVMSMEFGGQSQKIEIGTDNTWGAQLNLGLPLVAPGLWRTIQLTDLDISLAVEASRASRIDMIAAVKNAYYALLMAQDSYKVLKAGYDNAALNARIATDKYNQGSVSEFDKLRADVQLANQKPTVTAAENAVRLAAMQLKALMGVDVTEKIIFTGSLTDYEGRMSRDLAGLGDTTLSANSILRQFDIQEMQLEKVIQVTRSSYAPTLSLGGSYQWSSLNNDFKIGHYQWTPYATVGLTFGMPLYHGSAKKFQIRQNQINLDNLRLQRENTERNLELAARASVDNIEKSLAEVESNRQGMQNAERAFAISQKRYEVGSGNMLELNDSDIALTRARLSFNQSIYNYLTALTDLEKTLGASVDEQPLPRLKK